MTDTPVGLHPVALPDPMVEVANALNEINDRLARIESVIDQYEPLIMEATRRMAGPMRWRRGGPPA